MTQKIETDCIVIGSGPAGFYSALSCAAKGLKTLVIENGVLGGTGFTTGCLPLKRKLDIIRNADQSVYSPDNQEEKKILLAKAVVEDTSGFINKTELLMKRRLDDLNIGLIFGNGRFISEKQFLVNNKEITFRKAVISTGTSPAAPNGIILDGDSVISHIQAMALQEIPESMIIVGGNIEGAEIAALFSSMGTKVTIVEKLESVLEGIDRDLAAPALEYLTELNCRFITGQSVETVVNADFHPSAVLNSGNTLSAEKIVFTGTRSLNTPEGMEKAGIIAESSRIIVDSNLETNIKGIYVTGDANGISGSAAAAVHQGRRIVDCFSGEAPTFEYNHAPMAIFTIPEIAGAGIQENEITESADPYTVRKYPLSETWRGLSKGVNKGIMKMLFDSRNVLKGIWATGPGASELMGCSGLLLEKKLTVNDLNSLPFIHPTLAESIHEAVFF